MSVRFLDDLYCICSMGGIYLLNITSHFKKLENLQGFFSLTAVLHIVLVFGMTSVMPAVTHPDAGC